MSSCSAAVSAGGSALDGGMTSGEALPSVSQRVSDGGAASSSRRTASRSQHDAQDDQRCQPHARIPSSWAENIDPSKLQCLGGASARPRSLLQGRYQGTSLEDIRSLKITNSYNSGRNYPREAKWTSRPVDRHRPYSPKIVGRRCVVVCRSMDDGGDRGTRTPDLVVANDALSQLSYIPKTGDNCLKATVPRGADPFNCGDASRCCRSGLGAGPCRGRGARVRRAPARSDGPR